MDDSKIKIGIYCIENLINNKKYIGQSKNIYRRWKQHIKDSEIKQLPLYKSIRKYGIENFKFFILEECKITELTLREDYYITYYNSYVPNGYNLSRAETQGINKSVPDNILEIIKEIEKNELSLIDIAKKYNVSRSKIDNINYGIHWRLDYKKYPLREKVNFNGKIEEIEEMILKGYTISEIAKNFSTTIPTINGFLIKNNIKITSLRETLTSSRRIKIINLKNNEILYFRKKKDAAKWIYDFFNHDILESSYLQMIGYHLKSKTPYKGFLFEYAEREEV